MIYFKKIIFLICIALFLSGCQKDKEDLSAYVERVGARQVPKIEPIPEIKSYERFVYSAGELRDPFISTVVEQLAIELPVEEKIIVDNGIHPDSTRLKEALESYSLSELRLVGSLEKESVWALIRDPDGVIHKVKEGDFIGHDHGQILAVTETELILKEIVSDEDGGYIERDSSLSVIDLN